MRLPESVQEIAEVIGRERALYLIGKLPTYYDSRNQNQRVIMYVPKRLRTDHCLVRILGWNDAEKLVAVFGGEILKPANCSFLYRPFRDRAIGRLIKESVPTQMIAEWFCMTDRQVRRLTAELREKPQEETKSANDNNRS